MPANFNYALHRHKTAAEIGVLLTPASLLYELPKCQLVKRTFMDNPTKVSPS